MKVLGGSYGGYTIPMSMSSVLQMNLAGALNFDRFVWRVSKCFPSGR